MSGSPGERTPETTQMLLQIAPHTNTDWWRFAQQSSRHFISSLMFLFMFFLFLACGPQGTLKSYQKPSIGSLCSKAHLEVGRTKNMLCHSRIIWELKRGLIKCEAGRYKNKNLSRYVVFQWGSVDLLGLAKPSRQPSTSLPPSSFFLNSFVVVASG